VVCRDRRGNTGPAPAMRGAALAPPSGRDRALQRFKSRRLFGQRRRRPGDLEPAGQPLAGGSTGSV